MCCREIWESHQVILTFSSMQSSCPQAASLLCIWQGRGVQVQASEHFAADALGDSVQLFSDRLASVPPRTLRSVSLQEPPAANAGSLPVCSASPKVSPKFPICSAFLHLCGCLPFAFYHACREDEECTVGSQSQLQRASAQTAQSAGRRSPQEGPSRRTVTRPAERLRHEDPASEQPISGPASEVNVRSDVQQVGTGQQSSCMQRLGIC